MKYLLVLLVVGVAFWVALARARGARRRDDEAPGRSDRALSMARCARCGVHLPASDAVIEGSNVYCCDEHRRLGPAPTTKR